MLLLKLLSLYNGIRKVYFLCLIPSPDCVKCVRKCPPIDFFLQFIHSMHVGMPCAIYSGDAAHFQKPTIPLFADRSTILHLSTGVRLMFLPKCQPIVERAIWPDWSVHILRNGNEKRFVRSSMSSSTPSFLNCSVNDMKSASSLNRELIQASSHRKKGE